MTSERDAHPDEGTIHAWLDRQLDDATAAALETHLQRCDECAERVAEARGLIAGASRVIASLDDADAASGSSTRAGVPPAPPWRPAILPAAKPRGLPAFRFTPARSAIAAVLVVAVATAIVHENQQPSSRLASVAAESAAAVTTAPASPPATTRLDSTAAARVAGARAFAKAQRETTVSVADAARTGQVPAPQAAKPLEQTVAAAQAAENSVQQRGNAPGVAAGVGSGVAGGIAKGVATAPAGAGIEAPLCYRVESANGAAASWGPVALPFTLALDAPATRASARVVTADGRDTDVRARFERRGEDSLVFTLQRIGYSGTLAVGAPGEVSAGVMRSVPSTLALAEVVATAEPGGVRARRALRKSTAAEPARAASTARADSASTAPERDASPAVPVVVRKVDCAGRE